MPSSSQVRPVARSVLHAGVVNKARAARAALFATLLCGRRGWPASHPLAGSVESRLLMNCWHSSLTCNLLLLVS